MSSVERLRDTMLTRKKTSTVVGLDIEAGSIAAAEVTGMNGSSEPGRTAIAPLEPGIVSEGEVQNPTALAEVLSKLFDQAGLPKRVKVGLANQRVVVRTLRLPLIERDEEIDTAVRFQAQEQIPMPLEQAAFDYTVVNRSAGAEGERSSMDVIAVAARKDMLAILLNALREAGLRPEGIDLAAFGMIRALSRGDVPAVAEDGTPIQQPASLYCHLGDVTNIAVARGGNCLFTRVAPFGLEGIAQLISDREDVSIAAAREMIEDADLALDDPPQAVPATVGAEAGGQGAETAAPHTNTLSASGAPEDATIEEGARKIADEVRLSLEFYGAQEGAASVEDVVVSGPGSLLPGLPAKIEQSLGLPVEVRVPGPLQEFADEDAARLTVSYGLALEG